MRTISKVTEDAMLQILALAQTQNLDFFEYSDQFYIGTTQEEFDEIEKDLCDNDEIETREDIDQKLLQWIDDNGYTLLEDDFTVCSYDYNIIEYAGGEYLVVDEATANQLWDKSLQSYLDECVYPELPENIRYYFDDEKWKLDAQMDGRGHSLSTYDGSEDNAMVNDEAFCIFRVG